MNELAMYLCKNSLECFDNFGNCLLGDLIALLPKRSIAFPIMIVQNRVIIANAV
jgi:hypothetical protein